MSILKPKSHDKTRTLSVRLPAPLVAEIEALRADADAAGQVFDMTEIVGRALAGAVRQARSELSAICTQSADSEPASAGAATAPNARDAQQRNTHGANDRRESSAATAFGGEAG